MTPQKSSAEQFLFDVEGPLHEARGLSAAMVALLAGIDHVDVPVAHQMDGAIRIMHNILEILEDIRRRWDASFHARAKD